MDSCWKPRMADCTALFSNARWGITTTNLKVSLLVIATEILFSIAAPIPFSIRSAPAEQCNVSSAVDVDVVVVVVVVVDVDDLMLAHLPLQPPPFPPRTRSHLQQQHPLPQRHHPNRHKNTDSRCKQTCCAPSDKIHVIRLKHSFKTEMTARSPRAFN